jgi:hypothetical protein
MRGSPSRPAATCHHQQLRIATIVDEGAFSAAAVAVGTAGTFSTVYVPFQLTTCQ